MTVQDLAQRAWPDANCGSSCGCVLAPKRALRMGMRVQANTGTFLDGFLDGFLVPQLPKMGLDMIKRSLKGFQMEKT